jgi:macrodomain Ter protein organizer (MatP/YcbG family)
MSYDFSLSNDAVDAWLSSEDAPAPVREFIYVHEHPLIRPNFVSQIEVKIYDTGQHMIAKNISGAPAKRLVSLSETFVNQLSDFASDRTEDSATALLGSLRAIYILCQKILRM